MEIERETLVEIVTSAGAVLLFVVVLFVIGVLFNDNGGFNQSGALALVGAIVGFILLMSAVAFFLSTR